MHRPLQPLLFAIVALIAMCGCSTVPGPPCPSIAFRTGEYPPPEQVYEATAVDLQFISASLPTRENRESWHGLLFIPGAFLDLPLAVLLDTLFLPFDSYRLLSKKPAQKPHDSQVESRAGVTDAPTAVPLPN